MKRSIWATRGMVWFVVACGWISSIPSVAPVACVSPSRPSKRSLEAASGEITWRWLVDLTGKSQDEKSSGSVEEATLFLFLARRGRSVRGANTA